MRKGFISYAHEDGAMCQHLLRQLKPLERAGIATFWADYAVEAGDPWKEKIEAALQAADVALFLVSPDMFWSDFIWNIELPQACERSRNDNLQLIPVILRPCLWQVDRNVCLPSVQAVPRGGVPISQFSRVDDGYHAAVDAIAHRLMGSGGLLDA